MTTVYKEVGELVYYFNIRKYPRSQRQGGYSGPYLVIQVLSPVTVALQRGAKAKLFTVHVDKSREVLAYGTEVLAENRLRS